MSIDHQVARAVKSLTFEKALGLSVVYLANWRTGLKSDIDAEAIGHQIVHSINNMPCPGSNLKIIHKAGKYISRRVLASHNAIIRFTSNSKSETIQAINEMVEGWKRAYITSNHELLT